MKSGCPGAAGVLALSEGGRSWCPPTASENERLRAGLIAPARLNVNVLKQGDRVCEPSCVPRPWPVTALVLAVVVPGCGGGGDAAPSAEGTGSRELAAAERRLVHKSPPRLARLYAQGNELLDGGLPAFRARLRELRGYPVVVNKWASWCGPCRTELPFFRRQALARGRRVAFLGANTGDTADAARRFGREVPVTFPSYEDRDAEIARFFHGAIAFPSTAFYDRRGRLATVKQGVYPSERELAADIERYAR